MAYTAEVSRTNPSAFVFLIDQSRSMEEPFGGGQGKRKADGVADAINRLLQNLVIKCAKGEGINDYYVIGVIGYGGKVAAAFGGPLADKFLVPISEVANNPDPRGRAHQESGRRRGRTDRPDHQVSRMARTRDGQRYADGRSLQHGAPTAADVDRQPSRLVSAHRHQYHRRRVQQRPHSGSAETRQSQLRPTAIPCCSTATFPAMPSRRLCSPTPTRDCPTTGRVNCSPCQSPAAKHERLGYRRGLSHRRGCAGLRLQCRPGGIDPLSGHRYTTEQSSLRTLVLINRLGFDESSG